MNRTDPSTSPRISAELLGKLFDERVAPFAQARRNAGKPPYFPLGRDENAATYFRAPERASLRPADYDLAGGTAEGVLDALAARWSEQGETELVALVPRLREVASALAKERAESDGSVDVLCYTLF